LPFIQTNTKKIKQLIEKRAAYLPDVNFPIKTERQFGFSNPIHFGLIQVLQKFDDYILWLFLAQNYRIFKHQNGFYKIKNRIKKYVFKLLSKIILINSKEFLPVDFNNYFANDDIYKKMVKKYGEIVPQLLHNAITSTVTPPLT